MEKRGSICTFGTRTAVDEARLGEIIYREVKHFHTYKQYRPNFNVIPVSSKFYAAHHQIREDNEEQIQKIVEYTDSIVDARSNGPISKYSEPVTENQCYGWCQARTFNIDRNDNRFYHPKVESQLTKVAVIIACANPTKKAMNKPAPKPAPA